MNQEKLEWEKIKIEIANLDWIKILNQSIKNCPTSWFEPNVKEWGNASWEIYCEVEKAVKPIILSALSQQREKVDKEWRDKIQGMKKKIDKRRTTDEKRYPHGYNQALDDLLK